MTRNLRLWIERVLRAEDGQSLVLALLVVMVVTIAATATLELVTSTQNTSSSERQGARALTAADAGLDLAANAVLSTWNNSPTLPPDGTPASGSPAGPILIDGNSVNWTATYAADVSGGIGVWNLVSKTTASNGKVRRWLQETLQPTTSSQPGAPVAAYAYGFVTGGAPSGSHSCGGPNTTTLSGSAQITVPTWITGDLCVSGGSNPAIGNPPGGPAISVFIGGALSTSGNNYAIGTPTSHVTSAAILGGCWSSAGNVPCNSSIATGHDAVNGGSGVYADLFNPTLPTPAPSKPVLDQAAEQSVYNSASPGPMSPCGVGSTGTPPLFDSVGSTVPDTSLGSRNLVTLLGSSFDCKTASGELKWAPPHLFVSGTIFFDASLTLSGADSIQLDPNSRGSIYVDGTITISGGASFCADAWPCNYAAWTPDTDPSDPLIFFSAYNRSGSTYGFAMSGNTRFEGIAYTNGGFQLSGSATNAGSILGDFANLSGGTSFKVTGAPPPGALGGSTPVTTFSWSVAPRSWRECPAGVGC